MTVRMLLLVVVLSRLLAPVLLKPVGYLADWNDYYFFEGWAKFTDRGLYPYLDFWMEHPPLFPWLVVAAYRVSAAIPAWHDPHFAFALTFGLFMLIFDVGNVLLVRRIASILGAPGAGLAAAWIYALLFPLLFYWTAGFEAYPLFFLLLATAGVLEAAYLAKPGRDAARLAAFAGLAAGVGIMVKLVPGMILPAGVVALWQTGRRQAAVILTVCAVGSAVAIAAPFAIASPVMARASATSLLTRSGWETIWAFAEGYYSGGAVAKPETRLDPATASIVDRPPVIPMLPVLAIGGAIGVLALWRTRDWRRPETLIAALGLTLSLFLLTSKGYSPQFLVYVLAPILILWPNGRGVFYAVVLSAINLLEYPIALLLFDTQPIVLVTAVLLRTAALIALAAEYVRILLDRDPLPGGKRTAFGVAAAVALVTIGVIGFSLRTYSTNALAALPEREVVEMLRSRPASAAVFSDTGLYDRLTPFLQGSVQTRLVRPGVVPRLPEAGAEIWDVYVESAEGKAAGPAVTSALAAAAFPVDITTVAGVRLSRYAVSTASSKEGPGALGGIQLARIAYPASVQPGRALPVLLVWQAAATPGRDFTVFIHLADAGGTLVAQRDAVPVAGTRPTSGWRPGESIEDRHGVLIPQNTPAGDYRIRAGLYDPANGQRLTGPSGDSLDLGLLRIGP